MYAPNLSINALEDSDDSASAPIATQKKGFVDYQTLKLKPRPKTTPSSDRLCIKATVQYIDVIGAIDPKFYGKLIFIPRRTLTNPREPSKNNGYDNINDDYILKVKGILGDVEKYEILDLMGQGAFGQVVMCKSLKTGELVAVKVMKNNYANHAQSQKELRILSMLQGRLADKDRFLQLRTYFVFRGHMCMVLELLSISLHKVLSQGSGRPYLGMESIKRIAFNILETLALLKEMRIIHTDLKSDNILLKRMEIIHDVKLIDYGLAVLETDDLNHCVQPVSFRSPEVILRTDFGCAIDMWSFGCLIVELFTGTILFPSDNESVLLRMMTEVLDCFPPDHMLQKGRRTTEFFDVNSSQTGKIQFKAPHDKPLSCTTLKQKIKGLVSDDNDSIIDNHQEMADREELYDFLSHILVFDPAVRYTPLQALQHPFITSVMGKDAIRPSLRSNGHMPHPHLQLPFNLHTSKGTNSIPTRLIQDSLARAIASSSSINTSRTTDESSEILTPDTSQLNLQKQSPNKSNPTLDTLSLTLPKPPLLSIAKQPPKSILKIRNKDTQPLTAASTSNTPLSVVQPQEGVGNVKRVAFDLQSNDSFTPQSSDGESCVQLVNTMPISNDTFLSPNAAGYYLPPHQLQTQTQMAYFGLPPAHYYQSFLSHGVQQPVVNNLQNTVSSASNTTHYPPHLYHPSQQQQMQVHSPLQEHILNATYQTPFQQQQQPQQHHFLQQQLQATPTQMHRLKNSFSL